MSQTIHLSSKYARQLQQRFTTGSLLQGRLENDLDFVGARTVRVYTVSTVEVNDYDRTATANRYGVPTEVGDTVQELTLSQDKGFSGIIDKGNNLDQAINKAGKFLRVEIDEKIIPMQDAYGFRVLAGKAGRIVGHADAIAADNVLARLAAARAHLLNARVPIKGRTLFVSTDTYNALVDAAPFKTLEKLGTRALAAGQIGEIFGSPVVEVPDDLLPAGLNFLWLHQRAAASPSKIADTKVHIDPPGISGSQVEGRFYWDTFVFGAKADGIYADVTTSAAVRVLPLLKIDAKTGAISGAEAGATVQYTVDGSDPRYSLSAQSGMVPNVQPGQTLRACQSLPGEAGVYPSAVAAVVVSG